MNPSSILNPPYVIGIDAGTEAVKAGIFNLKGDLIASQACNYPTHFPKPGWAEQDPEAWWVSLIEAVQGCLAATTVNPEEIIGLSADATTCTLIPIKAKGQELRRALLWMDVRATEQAARIFNSGHEALRYSLAGVSAEWMPPKALWLKEHEPDIYNEADYLIEYTDWIAYRLTGRIALNTNTITQRWYYHPPSGGWPLDFFAQIGLDDLEPKLPRDILGLGEVVGGLSPATAELLGLPAGIPVAMGGGDAFVGLLGLGVTDPGDLGVVMGSSNVLAGLSTTEFHAPGIFGSFPDALIPGLNLVEGGQVSTGSILAWFKRNFAGDVAEEAKQKGVSSYQLLDAEAAQISVGSEGLMVLDYFQGNRTPHTDSLARGAIWGLSLQASRAHVFRALMEGIAYGMSDILETFSRQDYTVSRIIACGGATRSPLFMQIYADVLGQTIYLTPVAEASLLGSAVVAAAGAGAYPDLTQAAKEMVAISGEYQPNAERHQVYRFFVQKYQETYQQLKALMHEMSQKVAP